jgi:hypothetical protein
MVGHVIPRVIPHNFKRQPSGRFSITVQSPHLSHVIAATMYQRPSVHLGRPTWRPYMGVHSTDHLVSREWPAANFSFCGYRCHSGTKGSARTPAPPPLRLQKHNDLRAHYFAHSSHLWRKHRLADCSYAWSRRLCGITLITHYQSCWFKTLLNSFKIVRCIEVSVI